MSALSEARREALVAHDERYWQANIRIAGMDEAGCGALAGPVVAACVGMPPHISIPGVDDSKKLSPQQRGRLYDRIVAASWFVGIGMADVDEIERLNILNAARLAMNRAVEGLHSDTCDLLLIDARRDLPVAIPQHGIIHGDAVSYSIAAASIVAKVTRDRLMQALDADFPGYGFAEHKGYGTAKHYETISRLGSSSIHRPSFLKSHRDSDQAI